MSLCFAWLVQMNFAIVHHASDQCMEGIAMADNGEWSVLDLGQAAIERGDASQENIFGLHCDSIAVFKSLVPPVFR